VQGFIIERKKKNGEKHRVREKKKEKSKERISRTKKKKSKSWLRFHRENTGFELSGGQRGGNVAYLEREERKKMAMGLAKQGEHRLMLTFSPSRRKRATGSLGHPDLRGEEKRDPQQREEKGKNGPPPKKKKGLTIKALMSEGEIPSSPSLDGRGGGGEGALKRGRKRVPLSLKPAMRKGSTNPVGGKKKSTLFCLAADVLGDLPEGERGEEPRPSVLRQSSASFPCNEFHDAQGKKTEKTD